MRRSAFTLVELLVVIAILGVLAGIAFPVVAAARRRADHGSCAENLHTVGVGLTLYANDHDGWVPPATTQTRIYESSPRILVTKNEIEASPRQLFAAMRPYLRSEGVWFCPADRWKATDVVYLGQSHRLTSYRFFPFTEGSLRAWPPRMQLGDAVRVKDATESSPLVSDVVGIPSADLDPRFEGDDCARTNHPDDLVNALRHDLSLSRRPAFLWTGGRCRG